VETSPDLIVHNMTPTTTNFMVVIGKYNAQIVRSFGHPVVGLPGGWYADYKYFYPFSTARRCELVISRAMQASTATVEIPLSEEMRRAAATSADYATNVRVMQQIARDPWTRVRFKITNGGVLSVAQYKFRANDPFAREEYRKQFVEIPQSEREIADLCRPPQQESRNAVSVPPKPTVGSQFEWDLRSDEAKASDIYAWMDWWATRSTPSVGSSSGNKPVIQLSLPESEPDMDWKWRPTPEQLESLQSDDWKRN
jgi:hypothetical protein